MKFTDNLKLNLYESTDSALLTDGYNNSMYLLDRDALTKSTDINTLQQTVALLSDKYANLEARVTALESK